MELNKKRNVFLRIIESNIFIFFIAAAIMMIFTYNMDLLSHSFDAAETWAVAKTFFSAEKYYSYTMYKGVYAFLPCVLDYNLSALLHIPEMLILKIINALSFSYVAVYGIPGLMEAIFKKGKTPALGRYLLVLILVVFERNIIYFISVDMMSCMLFFLLCREAIKAFDDTAHLWKSSIYVGLLGGFNCCFSGQFTISTVIVLAAFVIRLFLVFKNDKTVLSVKRYKGFALSFVILVAVFLITRMPNTWYMNNVVEVARANGEWIPTGMEWIINGLSANIKIINYPRCLPDNLSMSMVTKEQLEQIGAGACVFTIRGYAKLILLHPVKFILRWGERLFLGIYNDPQNYICDISITDWVHIVVMAIMVFSFYEMIKKRFRKYSDFISVEFAVYIAFLFSALVPTFGHVENRYYFTMRCFVYGAFAATPFLKDAALSLKERFTLRKTNGVAVGYKFWDLIFFCLLSLIIYFAIYQIAAI